ncbi:type II secretion system protein GspD [Salmonella enterica subsp. enterica serovar Muenster]|nr:type II secretion system protein GspD [Salmonella enterica subsp. enterica serovar Muenster]EGP2908752.1 type II secretion system protein GspD [Salmonella enterica subsp. enterica serovar Muenster]EHX6840574.1 type II secretion system protein GspD [Salmonella enterica subsp. enterica serovar Muenster]
MKTFLIFFLLISFNVFSKGTNFSLQSVAVPDAITIMYTQIFKKPFMIAPEVIIDDRKVAFHITEDLDEKAFLIRYLSNMNIGVSNKGGVDYLYPIKEKAIKERRYQYSYKPKYRSVAYLNSVLQSIVPDGKFGHSQSANGVSTTSKMIGGNNVLVSGDLFVFYGTKESVSLVQEVIPTLDTPTEEVYVGGYVYEVQTNAKNGSGLALAAELLNSHLNIQIGNINSSGGDNFIKFSSGSLSALYQLFNTDSRFSVVSSPALRARSGAAASFAVGSDVPVLGNVSYQGDSSVQSVEYRSSGVIFNVYPEVRENMIDLTLSQELSNFAKTETGVNNSPTLIKRSIQTSVSVQDGDIIMIGGLADTKDNSTDTSLSFLPMFGTKGTDKSKTDIVIILQAKRVKR